MQWVNQKSQSIKDLHAVEDATNSSSELGVFVQSDDVFSDEFTTFVHDFTRDQLATQNGKLLTGSSIETAVGDLISVPGASDIAPTGDEVKAAFARRARRTSRPRPSARARPTSTSCSAPGRRRSRTARRS